MRWSRRWVRSHRVGTISSAPIFCEVRYLNEVPEHEAVLALLAAMARWASEG